MLASVDDLIQGGVDETLTAQEQPDLEQLLAQSGPAREQFESLRELARALNDVPLVAVPSVRDSVLDRIRLSQHQRPMRSPSVGRRAGRRAFVIGWAAAAAVIIAIGVQRLPHLRDLSGEHAGGAVTRPSDDGWTTVARFVTDGSTLVVRQNGQRFVFLPRVPAEGRVTIQWVPEQLDFVEAVADADLRERDRGLVTFPPGTAPMSLMLISRNSGVAAPVTVTVAGKELFRWTVVSP